MLRIFKSSITGKTVPKNCLFYSIYGAIPSTNVTKGCGFNSLLDLSFFRFSSAARKKLSSTEKKPEESLPHPDAGEKYELFFSGATLCDMDDLPLKTLENNEEKMGKNMLKEDNLELFKKIANGDNEVLQLLRQLQIKLDITSCQYGIKVNLKKEDWIEFLNHSPSKRKSFVAHSIINTIRSVKRKIEQPILLYDLPENDDDDEIPGNNYDVRCYHLFHNAMFMKLRSSAIKRMYYMKGFTAMLYSSCIVFDCSYNSLMTSLELKELAKQIVASLALNMKSEQPYHIMLCNFNKNDKLAKHLEKFNPIIFNDDYPLTITEKSYLELFPTPNLVYLTPHCKTTLKSYDSNMTYIVGSFVDKTSKKPISLAKAKEQNLAMAKFPLDEFLDWGLGNKCLSLPHVTAIMLNLKIHNGNWYKAFDIIPKRFLEKTRPKNTFKSSLESEIMNTFHSVQSEMN